MYTDGGGATEQWRHTAGWGCAVASSTHGHTEAHLRLGQLRLDEHRAVEERGSTNNDAELRGLLEAAREASKLAHAFTAANANGVNTCSAKPWIHAIHTCRRSAKHWMREIMDFLVKSRTREIL